MTLICNQSTRSPRRRNFKPNFSIQTNKPRGDTELDWFICFRHVHTMGLSWMFEEREKTKTLVATEPQCCLRSEPVKVKEPATLNKIKNRKNVKIETTSRQKICECEGNEIDHRSSTGAIEIERWGRLCVWVPTMMANAGFERRVWKWKFLDARRMVRSLRQRLPEGDRNFERLMCAYKLG